MNDENIKLILSKLSEISDIFSFDNFALLIILQIVSVGLGAYFGAYLKKSAENKAINENLDNLKIQIEETTKITEEIKSDVSQKTHEHYIKFEKYHNRQVEVIEKLYELLIDLESYATTYIATSNFNEGKTEDFLRAEKATQDFIHYANRTKIWVHEDIYEQIESLAKLLNKHVFSVFVYISSKTGSGESIDKSVAAGDKAIEILESEVPTAKEAILQKIRAILNPSNPKS